MNIAETSSLIDPSTTHWISCLGHVCMQVVDSENHQSDNDVLIRSLNLWNNGRDRGIQRVHPEEKTTN